METPFFRLVAIIGKKLSNDAPWDALGLVRQVVTSVDSHENSSTIQSEQPHYTHPKSYV